MWRSENLIQSVVEDVLEMPNPRPQLVDSSDSEAGTKPGKPGSSAKQCHLSPPVFSYSACSCSLVLKGLDVRKTLDTEVRSL